MVCGSQIIATDHSNATALPIAIFKRFDISAIPFLGHDILG